MEGDAIQHYRFGFEVEVVLGLRQAVTGLRTRDAVVSGIVDLLKDKLSPLIVTNGMPGQVNYNQLSVVHDDTIKSLDDRFETTMFDVEFVSPIFRTVNDDGIDMLNRLWEVLDERCECETENFTCGTHIHVSPLPREGDSGNWSIHDLQAIARAILVFDPVMDALVPEGRRKHNAWSTSNIFAPLVEEDILSGGGTLRVAFEMIGRMTNADQLCLFMSPWKKFAFDFTQLTTESKTHCGTIEFRRPPMSRSPGDTLRWANFACLFFTAAVAQSDSIREIYAGRSHETDVGILYEFLKSAVDTRFALFGDKYLTDIFLEGQGQMKIYDRDMTVNGLLPAEQAYREDTRFRLAKMMGCASENDQGRAAGQLEGELISFTYGTGPYITLSEPQ